MSTKRRPRLPICSVCNARHREPMEYTACARTHTAARAIIVRQIEQATSGLNLQYPKDILEFVVEVSAREMERANLRAQGTITPDTLPKVTREQLDAVYGVVIPGDEFGEAGRASMLAGDRWCWFEGRAWSRGDPRLKMAMRTSGRRVA